MKEQNYGADWGDFATFARRMKQTAEDLDVDLLLIDTGDLHDGAGLSDATTVDGTDSMPIFDDIDFDLLTIGMSCRVKSGLNSPSTVWPASALPSNALSQAIMSCT